MWVVAEVEPALFDVRAGDVDLEAGHAWDPIEPCRELSVLVGRFAVDVDEHREVPLGPLRSVVADEAIDAWSLKADCVEHPRGCLDDARRRRAGAGTPKDALRVHRAERPAP